MNPNHSGMKGRDDRTATSEAATLLLGGGDPEFVRVVELLEQVSETDVTVLIGGESGTGKELAAKAVHQLSERRNGPCVKINCAALPGELLESELFGYEKGAFTGADRRKRGKFECADGGTLFLDEIGEMALPLQAKLLQAIEDHEFSPLGSEGSVKVDVRIVAATNRNLEQDVEAGAFRQDLYYRLNVVTVELPPLRERLEAIPALAHHFLLKYNAAYSRDAELSPEILDRFARHEWPGNVRQLENVVKRLVILGSQLASLEEPSPYRALAKASAEIRTLVEGEMEDAEDGPGLHINLLALAKRASKIAERHVIEATLRETGWNRVESARRLQIAVKSMAAKMREYDLCHSR